MPSRKTYSLASILLFLVIFAALFFALFIPTGLTGLFPHADKAGHFAAFAGLSFAGRFSLPRVHYLYLLTPLLFFAIGAEFFQATFRPDREFSLWDIIANLSGVMSGIYLATVFKKKYILACNN
ncbi:hypothetical protein [Amphritea sp. HPY]|uniref:hypothetical protein n=1 Tax=Amphritea sp. HPY TaxID=3421652 RepID=UPI003D7D4885